MRVLQLKTNCHTAMLVAGVLLSLCLFSGAELLAFATAANESIHGKKPDVHSNTSLPHFVASHKVSTVLLKRFKRQSVDQSLLTSPCAYDSRPAVTYEVLTTNSHLAYGLNLTSVVSQRGPPALVRCSSILL